MDTLIKLHRSLQKTIDTLGVRPVARWVFRYLYTRRYAPNQLARAVQNGREWWMAPEVALRGELQEFETVQWFRDVIQPGMTVVDVGANVGQMTLEMAHLVGPSGRVIAIEPAPGNLNLLRRHVSANGFDDRVTIIPAACVEDTGAQVELVVFGAEPDTVGSGHQVKCKTSDITNPGMARKVVKVGTVSIDDLCRDLRLRPQVLKIDVEGAEERVLQGAKLTLAQARPRLRIGFHPFAFENPKRSANSIMNLLLSLGYQPVDAVRAEDWGLAEYVFNPVGA